jgi:hypothetical protein
MGGHAALLERWFSNEIEPLHQRHQESASVSLRRKINALREAVQASLHVRLDRRDGFSHLDPVAIEQAKSGVRRTAVLFVPTLRRCERLAESLTPLGHDVLHQAAAQLARDGRSVQEDPRVVVDAVSASLRDVVGERVERIRIEVGGLATASAQAIDRAASVLGMRAELLHPEINDLPQLAFAFSGFTIPRASLLAFNRALHVHYIEHHLRRQLGVRLDESLTAHGRLMEGWARRAIEARLAAFEQQAEPIRTRFECARRPASGETEADEADGLRRDLQELEQLGQTPQR